jgi:hypothetical protein
VNPNNQDDLTRLRRAISHSRRKLQPFRSRHRQAIAEYVGIYYSDDGAEKPVHLNFMEMSANIYERQLAARPPKVLVSTHDKQFRPYGIKLEIAMNNMLKDYTVHRAIRRCVKSALFSIGIMKVGTQVIGSYEEEGYDFQKSRPYAAHVMTEDWVHDMTANIPEEFDFCGHRFRMDLEPAKERKDFSKKSRENLTAIEGLNFNEQGDERIGAISQGTSRYEGFMTDKVELWEIYLPKEKLVVTLSENEGDPPLKVVDWEGPPNQLGPYHMLWFTEVDGNSMPLAPSMLWRGLHEVANNMFRKLVRESDAYKVVGLVRGVDSEDAQRIMNASDGEVVGVENPSAIEERTFGGIDQRNFALLMQIKQMYSWFAGNLDLLGGLGAQSETLGQDQLLFSSASQRVAGMQDEVRLFTKNVVSDFGFHLWNDPIESYPIRLNLQPLGPVDTFLEAEERDSHDFTSHMVDIEPFSMQFTSPQERLQKIMQITQNVALPALPMLQQQGLGLDWKELFNTISRYADLPELKDIIVGLDDVPPQSEQLGPGNPEEQQQGPQSPQGPRPVQRRGSTGASQQGAEQTLMNTMMGGNQQPAEMEAMMSAMGGA